jgi:predicted glutamine amidotransferase
MCGIFGYHGPNGPDPTLFGSIALEAGRRGPHGFGWAARHPDLGGSRLSGEHRPGTLSGHLADINRMVAGASTVLGHCRLATVGDWQDAGQLQPILSSGHAVAHNGVIDNPDDLEPGAATDSIALARAYARLRYDAVSPYTALDKLMGTAQARSWAVVVLDSNGRLYAHRHYHPLWRLITGGGIYLSSRRFHPDCDLLPEDIPTLI